MEATFSLPPQDHGQPTSIGRDSGRFEQGFLGSLQNLDSLSVLEPPQAVTSALRGQVKQRPAGKAWRARPHCWQSHPFRVSVFGRAIQNRYGPEARTWIGYRGHEMTTVGAGANRQVLFRSVRDAARRSAVGIECPQPWSRAVMILRDIEDVTIVDRCWKAHIRVMMSEPLRVSAGGCDSPQIQLPGGLNAAGEVNPSTVGRPCLMMVVPSHGRIDKNLFGADAGTI